MSDELQKEKEVVALERKLVNTRGQQEFVLEVRKMDKAQLDDKLLDLAKYAQAVDTTRKSDDALKAARDVVKGLNQPYNEDLRNNKEKARFVALVMAEEFGED